MPLRRSVSTPVGSMRSNPYPSSLSLSAAHALNAGGPHRPRRSASDSNGRRVLADIEWWRVMDGQEPRQTTTLPARVSHDENTEVQLDAINASLVNAGIEPIDEQVLRASRPATVDDDNVVAGLPEGSQGASSLTAPFSALSITSNAPSTPQRARRSVSDASEADTSIASDSSLCSTPASSPRTPASVFRESLLPVSFSLGFSFANDSRFNDCVPFAESIPCASLDFSYVPSPRMGGSELSSWLPKHSENAVMRSVSFGGFESPREPVDDDVFGDIFFP